MAIGCLCALAVPAQVTVPPDELQYHAKTYVPPTAFSLKTESRLVDIGVVVRDSRNHTVGGLTREDFEIEDGGKKRDITAFNAEVSGSARSEAKTAPPAAESPATTPHAPARYLALLFDDLSMSAGDLIPARQSAKRFVSQGISPGDQVSLFILSKGQTLPFTADTARINEALDKLNVATRVPLLPRCPNLTSYEAYVIANRVDPSLLPVKVSEAYSCGYCQRGERTDVCSDRVLDECRRIWEEIRLQSYSTLAAIRAIVDYLAKLPGKRVLLMTSSGFISGTLEQEREDLVNRALQADVVINSIDAKGLYTQSIDASNPGMNSRSMIARQGLMTRANWESNDTMAILAASTGGLFFHNNNDLEMGFRELGLLPEYSYSMAFTPPGNPDGKYHSLKVRLKKHRGDVQARPGYFASIAAPARPPEERSIDKALTAADMPNDVPVGISGDAVQTAEGPGIRVRLHVEMEKLPFANQFGIRTEKLAVIAALYDQSGSFVTGKECELDFNLKDNTYRSIASGLDAGLTLIAAPGSYQLRGVVREANGGKLTVSSRTVTIP